MASSSQSMGPWGATATPFTPIFAISGHRFCVQTVRCQPQKNNLLHMDASIILCCSKWPPLSNFVTSCTPRASAFTWVTFVFTGKFPANLSVVEKHNILLLRRKTCALLRAKTSALLRRKTCAVLAARASLNPGARQFETVAQNSTFRFLEGSPLKRGSKISVSH